MGTEPKIIELIATYLAGLGFFFTGMSGISDNLRQITGRRFRLLLSRATNHPVWAALLGVASGVVTQSTSVVAWILSGMIAGGLIPLRRALVVLACANIGTAGLVFIAAVDLHLPILFLIGKWRSTAAMNTRPAVPIFAQASTTSARRRGMRPPAIMPERIHATTDVLCVTTPDATPSRAAQTGCWV